MQTHDDIKRHARFAGRCADLELTALRYRPDAQAVEIASMRVYPFLGSVTVRNDDVIQQMSQLSPSGN
jgi:hypothetical protein